MVKRTFIKEADVKAEVKQLLKKYNYFYWMPANNGFGKSGTADLLAIRKGVFLAIETKFGNNKPTALQKAFLQSIMVEDGFGFVVNENTVAVFSDWLAAFDRSAEAASNKKPVAPEDGALMLNCIKVLTSDIV